MGENREMLRSMNTILRVNKMALRGSLTQTAFRAASLKCLARQLQVSCFEPSQSLR